MKRSIRSLAALLALLLLLASLAATMVACNDGGREESSTESSTESNTTGADNGGTDTPNPQKATYTVSVKTIGGRPVPDLSFRIYKGDSDDLVEVGATGEDGIGTVQIPAANDYRVEFPADKLEGYNVKESYTFTGASLSVVLTSSVIEDDDLTGVSYALGDVMHDFTVTTTEGTEFKLSDVLKTKKAVMINF